MNGLLRWLLRLYPAEFRERFGADLALVFRDAWRDAGPLAQGRLLLDVLLGGLRERIRPNSQPLIPNPQSLRPMRDLFAEFRQALRSLARAPGFSLAVILTLGLGIGANTAIFSVVDGVLLRPAPFENLDRLTMVWETDRKSGTTREPASMPDYFDFQERTRSFERIAAFSPITVTLTPDAGEPLRVPALWVSHEFLPLVGIRPLLGATFTAEQDQRGAPSVALISEALWTERFQRARSVVGSSIRVGETPFTIIGVLPASADFGTLQILGVAAYRRGFADRSGQQRVELWLPLQADRAADRGNHPIFMIGRLSSGGSVALAQQEMGAIAADLERLYPEPNDGRGIYIEPLSSVVFGGVKPALLVLVGAVALVLLVACANVANLLLARGAARAREVTVRAALGASLIRLTRQFLVESAMLTLAGVLVGLLLAQVGLALLLALAPGNIPRVAEVGIDARVLVVTLALAGLVGLAFGMVPAIQARRRGANLAVQGEASRGASAGREQHRFRSGLVVAELALAVMLMVGAGLLIKSLWRLYQVDPGFQVQGVLKAEFQLPGKYPQRRSDWPRWQEIRRFGAEVQRRVAALPGVTSVALAGAHPLEAGYTSSISVVGREAEAADWPEPSIRLVDPGYPATLRVPLLEGRALSDGDDLNAPPVVAINQTARDRFFARRPALGQRISLWGSERTVVGIYADERFHGLAERASPALYLPSGQAPIPNGSILVRVARDPAAFAAVLRGVVREIEPEVVLSSVEPLVETLSQSTAQRRFTMLVLGVFAGVALLLAMVGVHGVLSYTVAQRSREIGIRMALGADRANVGRLVVGQGARLALAGLTLGVLGALAAARLLASLLYGVRPYDPATFTAVALGLGAVALLASWLPARRATRVDPMIALRAE
ncbi:MAG TPA: ABC transporter permease [Gemmatimonadales bacterium]|jgi:putative ABC transport system permease protein|nr:ABC transporter permease [Gemmatimonadales bacterium]